jgi:branched-chain amino acid transport system ATP-binding protein
MLEIRNLNKSFDGVQAVQDFSVSLQAGKITSLIGPNGAGKTTAFNVATGFLAANSGEISLEGHSLNRLAPWRIARLGVSRTFQNLRLFRRMTVLDNVLIGIQRQKGEYFLDALIRFSSGSREYRTQLERAKELLEFVGLSNQQNDLAGNLSYGQQKLLSIACCLATEPRLLLLDEPVAGVQPAMTEKIKNILQQLVGDGKTVFLIEHDIGFVLSISDTVVVMDEGKKIAEDKPAAIRNNPEILEAYLS